jgi:hypothetical protein
MEEGNRGHPNKQPYPNEQVPPWEGEEFVAPHKPRNHVGLMITGSMAKRDDGVGAAETGNRSRYEWSGGARDS